MPYKYCRQCEKKYFTKKDFCPRCGTMLVDLIDRQKDGNTVN